ncbi:hypothetical protein I6A60_30820 [Frankia sp. AgB1.9]|uniref:hypothetical protein n=1 Tax=unclassified Frankia TaxID=2632575 RepID=UPI001931F1B2|nr:MULTISPECIES: hypothetical protein [unclassified Frankia]MBL7552224.1 hypothetical protein [Frankia sp. AgB1.9]MBL7622018.1 hypothetical protein [Frankia sp. AgB1.8]
MPVVDRARIAEALPGVEFGRELGSGVFGLGPVSKVSQRSHWLIAAMVTVAA